jgi:hypothetical protein
MHTKGGLSVNYHTGELAGISKNAFEVRETEREFHELNSMIEQAKASDTLEVSLPQPTKKFLVFIATAIIIKEDALCTGRKDEKRRGWRD